MMGTQQWKAKEIKVMYTNADMLMNKRNELRERANLEWPEIIGINEVKYKNPTGKDIQSKAFEMENDKYEMFKNNLEEKEPGRGQLIYVDKRLNAERLTLKTPAEEVLAVQIKRGNGENLIVALFYRSPSSQKENNKKIRQEINELCEKYNTEIVMMGDFNYKEINWEEDTGKGTEQEKFLECSKTY